MSPATLCLLCVLSAAPTDGAASPTPEASSAPSGDVPSLLRELATAGHKRASAALIALGPAVVPSLAAELEDPRWSYRWRVVNVLGYLRSEAALGALAERVLSDPEMHVRWRALWAISSIRADGGLARDVFRRELAGEDDRRGWQAAVGLAYFRDKLALARLHDGLLDTRQLRRFEAAHGLQSIHDERTSKLLAPRLGLEADADVRRQCVVALETICDDTAKRALLPLVGDGDRFVRQRAIRALGTCRARTSLRALRERRAVETEKDVIVEIDRAIRRLE